MHLKLSAFGIGFLVFTGTTGESPFSTFTVEVITLTGLVTSFIPYSAPLSQLLPLTLFSSAFTFK